MTAMDNTTGIPQVETEEGWHTVEDGTKLYTKTWKPPGEVKARMVFVHGFSDHCNIHYALFPTLASRGIEVYGFDQRGWGRSVPSTRHRGRTGSTSTVLSDISSILSSHLPPSGPSTPPLFLMGHSMGGAEVLVYASLGPKSIRSQIRGYIAEAPFIAVHPSSAPFKITVVIGRVLARLIPNLQMVQKLDSSLVSRDEQVCRDFEKDELCHDTGTLEGMGGMLDRAAELLGGKLKVGMTGEVGQDGEGSKEGKMSLLIAHGTADKITSFDATKKFVEESCKDVDDLEFRVFEGWFHKLHTEPGNDKFVFINHVADWILARAGTGGAGVEAGEVDSNNVGEENLHQHQDISGGGVTTSSVSNDPKARL